MYLKVFHYNGLVSDEKSISELDELPRYHFVLISEEVDNDYWRLVKY